MKYDFFNLYFFCVYEDTMIRKNNFSRKNNLIFNFRRISGRKIDIVVVWW